jgi:hypothetical protein
MREREMNKAITKSTFQKDREWSAALCVLKKNNVVFNVEHNGILSFDHRIKTNVQGTKEDGER